MTAFSHVDTLRALRSRHPNAEALRIAGELALLHHEREGRDPARFDAMPVRAFPAPALAERAAEMARRAAVRPVAALADGGEATSPIAALAASYAARWGLDGVSSAAELGPGMDAVRRARRRSRAKELARSPLSVQTLAEFPPVDNSLEHGGLRRDGDSLDVARLRGAVRQALRPLHKRGSNLRKCGAVRHSKTVEARISRAPDGTERGHTRGLVRCGSVWGCPCCAPRISSERARQLVAVISAHRAATRTPAAPEGAVYLLTLTVPHTAADRLRPMHQGVQRAWKFMQQGAPWLRLKADMRFAGSVAARETTVGGNGWHPHLHILLTAETPWTAQVVVPGLGRRRELKAIKRRLYRRWADACERAGLGVPSYRRGISLEVSHREDYIAKMGLADELTGAAYKQGRAANRTPVQLMADYAADGSADDARLVREWLKGTKGARQLTWSRGAGGRLDLRKRYASALLELSAESAPAPQASLPGYESPEEIVARLDADGVTVAELPGRRWDALVRVMRAAGADAEVELIRATESAGADGVESLLAAAGRLGAKLATRRPKLRRWLRYLGDPAPDTAHLSARSYADHAARALADGGKLYVPGRGLVTITAVPAATIHHSSN